MPHLPLVMQVRLTLMQLLNKAAFCLCMFGLVACQPKYMEDGGRASMANPPPPNITTLKHTLAVRSNNPDLQVSILEQLNAQPQVVTTADPTQAQFQLTLQSVPPTPTASTGTRWQGQLAKVRQQFVYPVNYTLSDRAGQILRQGTLQTTSAPQTVIWPSQSAQPAPSPAVTQQWSQQVLTEIMPHINAIPWQATVVGIVDNDHVTIDAGPETGLVLRAQLMTATHPKALLEVVNFELLPSGQLRTTLRVLEGLQPQPGRSVIKADY